MASEKTVNYTAEQTAEILAMYAEGKTVEQIAEATKRSVRSVVAKLSRECVYKSKAEAKTEKRQTKADLVAAIATALAVDVAEFETFEKASREALVKLAAKLAKPAEAE